MQKVSRIYLVVPAILCLTSTTAHAIWNFSFPANNQTFSKNTGDGTGNATANANIQYRLVKSVNPLNVNKQKDGTAASTGGWYLVLPTPLDVGANQTAQLRDMDNGGAVMASSTQLTVTN